MNCAVEDYRLTGNYDVGFTAYAPLHTFKGWTRQDVEAQIGINFDTATISYARARAQTCCFDTGFDDRNKAMADYMQIEKYPESSIELTEVKAFTRLDDTRLQIDALAVLEFMGQRRQLPVNFFITRNGSGFSIGLDFKWSFKAYGLKAPRLLFLTVRDIVDISGKGEFVPMNSAG
ncbi:YceI family protein [Desulfobacter curvatus]|uniref:YceI family protein n=1 Tax=Desulfobacter curvatus TaxID=2290 RepID=UPI00036DED93|nr:YceI family protein [Desulfobacter curvatus]